MKNQPVYNPPKPAGLRAFTLIELLTVIVIIGILAAIIIPTVGKVRDSAKDATCKSNLRQITTALTIYAVENKRFPPSRQGQDDGLPLWRMYLAPYFGGKELQKMQVYVCPSRVIIPRIAENLWFPTYAFHPRICPDTKEGWGDPKRPEEITRPSQIILVADATQQGGTNDDAYGQSHTNFWTVTEAFGTGDPANADKPIKLYSDADPGTEGGAVFRYRHNGKANFGFVDGHVAAIKKGEVLERHVRLNY
jgi:prepilin-type processing-associated H-X9-DG protein/prepilin-type N-terminal cleavage/methylation domain-containing protein